MEIERLKSALLDLGLEDLVPLPEIASTSEIRKLVSEGATVPDIADALVQLSHEKRIQVWVGHWSAEPHPIDSTRAELLLRDVKQYQFNSPVDRRQRIYFVNVENISV